MVDGLTLKLSWEAGSDEANPNFDDGDAVGQGELSSIARQIHTKAVQRALSSQDGFKEPCRTGASSDSVQVYLLQLSQPVSPGRAGSADPSVDVSELLRLSECSEGAMSIQGAQLSLYLPSQTAIYG